jgi:hypothetical protein
MAGTRPIQRASTAGITSQAMRLMFLDGLETVAPGYEGCARR